MGPRGELAMMPGLPGGSTKAALLRRRVAQGPIWLPVAGDSMGRTIRGGSEVLVAAGVCPHFGEVWAYCTVEGVVVVHRFLRRRREALQFQGDAHWPDPPVTREQLVGRVLCIRFQGREHWLSRWEGLAGGARLLLRGHTRTLARRLGGRRLRDLLAR